MVRYVARPAHRYALCSHSLKQRYRSLHDAKLVLGQIRRQHSKALRMGFPTRRLESRAYKCPHCSGWHLTSKPLLN
ncbi:MAG: hypothetical protein ACKO83_00155 [Roseiflexaceae bacterium]